MTHRGLSGARCNTFFAEQRSEGMPKRVNVDRPSARVALWNAGGS